jgi:hypothetical protein
MRDGNGMRKRNRMKVVSNSLRIGAAAVVVTGAVSAGVIGIMATGVAGAAGDLSGSGFGSDAR